MKATVCTLYVYVCGECRVNGMASGMFECCTIYYNYVLKYILVLVDVCVHLTRSLGQRCLIFIRRTYIFYTYTLFSLYNYEWKMRLFGIQEFSEPDLFSNKNMDTIDQCIKRMWRHPACVHTGQAARTPYMLPILCVNLANMYPQLDPARSRISN